MPEEDAAPEGRNAKRQKTDHSAEEEALGAPAPGRPRTAPPPLRTSTGALEGQDSDEEFLGAPSTPDATSSTAKPRLESHRTVALSGFKNDAMNTKYVERFDAETSVNGRTTFWAESGACFIYFCVQHQCWTVASTEDLKAVQAGSAKVWAAAPKEVDLLDPAMPKGWFERENKRAVDCGGGVSQVGTVEVPPGGDFGSALTPLKGASPPKAASQGQPKAAAEGKGPAVRKFKVTSDNKVGLLPKPDISATPSGHVKSGKEFKVSEVHTDAETGRRYVKLANGQGWIAMNSRKDPTKAVIAEVTL